MHRGLLQAQANQVSTELWSFCSEETDASDEDKESRESFRQEWSYYIDPIMQIGNTVQEKIQRMYNLNVRFTAWACKVSNLVPIYNHDAKYIRIDTRTLWELLGRSQGTGLRLENFQDRREEFFRRHFNLPSRLFSGSTRVPNFNYMIDTDGVGASVHIFRWKWILIRENESTTARKERLQQEREERFNRMYQHIRDRAQQEDLTWVGVDPGRKNVVTASKLDDDEEHWSFKISSGQYHHRIKSNERKQRKEAYLHRAGVLQWLLDTPSMKTHSAGATLNCIQRTFASDHLNQVFRVNASRQAKHLRWRVYIHRMKTLDDICKSIAGENPNNTIVAYGSGKFNPSSRGYKPSPTRDSYIKNRLKYVHRVTVLPIWEFNTSQICSKCLAPIKLCGVATHQDPFMTPAHIIDNHHFVRRCTNHLCRTIWHRDVNAGRNMAYLAIHLVYQVDRPDPFNSSVPQPQNVHDNDVVQAAASA